MTRLSAALNSDDLSHRDTDCDTDVLCAVGLTSIQKSLGVLILEAREGAAGESSHSVARIRALEEALQPYVKRWAMRYSIRLNVAPVASQLVRELVLDKCGVCQGRGFIPMRYDGQRMVAVVGVEDAREVDCDACLGSGQAKRDYVGRAKAAGLREYSKALGEWWEAALSWCTDMELDARRAMMKKIHGTPLRNS